jgi:hypothetical protein
LLLLFLFTDHPISFIIDNIILFSMCKIVSAECEPKTVEEAAKKLLQDCIKRVKDKFLRLRHKEIVSTLRGAGATQSSDQLEQIMNINRNRRSLNRDS